MTGSHDDSHETRMTTPMTGLETTARVFAGLHRSAEEDVARVAALYEQWVKAGPPPLGTGIARWWDRRLVELHDAIAPPAAEPSALDPRRRCQITDVVYGQCVLYLVDHPAGCIPERKRCTCGDAGDCFTPAGHYDDCPQAAEDTPAETELSLDEARTLADELGYDLYRAQDALAFVEECCVIADREGRQVATADVRTWLKGAQCGRQLLVGPPAETDEERTDRLETERDHAAGDHTYCGITCEVELPTEQLRNFVVAKGYPGTAGALDELLRRAAAPPPPVGRAVVLCEAATAAYQLPTPDCAEMGSLTNAWGSGVRAVAAELRRLADESEAAS